ncbi:hypothetical protein Goshw_005619 [Gossypium schwendimanii]|uniref:Uncharacterized protein n=1 Tax=Gossypium schwendimanii TaxID=34291 RepID=A0A7J9MTI9_GOSSC|nr:hypothetical protein [Gossypium schwendimanii]
MPPNRSKAILVPPVASSSEEDVEYSKIQSTLLNQQSPSPRKPAKSGSHKPLASSSKQPGESELDANEVKRPKKKVEEEGMVTAPVVDEISLQLTYFLRKFVVLPTMMQRFTTFPYSFEAFYVLHCNTFHSYLKYLNMFSDMSMKYGFLSILVLDISVSNIHSESE